MKRHLLNVAAVVSLMVVTLLCVGFAGRIGIITLYNPNGARSCSAIDLNTDQGRIECYVETCTPPPKLTPVGLHFTPHARFLPFRAPKPGRALWEFDAHSMPLLSAPTLKVFLLACPIWCACVPFLIAPVICFIKWREDRRKREEVEGFSVIQNAPTS